MLQDEEAKAIFLVFIDWINIQGYQHKRRFLYNHPELLNPTYHLPFSTYLAGLSPYPQARWAIYHKYLLLLQQAHVAGGNRQAIDAAFVNFFGGFSLDLPAWLQQSTQQLTTLQAQSQDAEQYFDLLTSLLQQAHQSYDMQPETLATLYRDQAQALLNLTTTTSFHHYQQALDACQAALEIYRETSLYPIQYASVQMVRAAIYGRRVDGEQRANLEEAIHCALSACSIFTQTDFPVEWASLYHNIGSYFLRHQGDMRAQNLQQAILFYKTPLENMVHEHTTHLWAKLQLGLGETYYAQAVETYAPTAQMALHCFEHVLNTHPSDEIQALALLYLGNTHLLFDHITTAISCYEQALLYYTVERNAVTWATLQKDLGTAYAHRPGHQPFADPRLAAKHFNASRSRRHYQAALEIFQIETFTQHFRDIHSLLADLAMDEADWETAHLHYQEAQQAQIMLLQSSTGMTGQDVILSDEKNISTKNGYALLRLGRITDAIIALESGRTRGLIQTFLLQEKLPVHDPLLRQAFETAQADLQQAQHMLSILEAQVHFEQHRAEFLAAIEHCRMKQKQFSAILQQVRSVSDHWTLPMQEQPSLKHIFQAAYSCGNNHALVYLAATYHGGMAIAAISNKTLSPEDGQLQALELPELTYTLVRDLIHRTHSTLIIGGYAYIQGNEALSLLCQQWPGETLRSCIETLHAFCLQAGIQSTLEQAALTLLDNQRLAPYVDLPFSSSLWQEHMSEIASQLSYLFVATEFQYITEALAGNTLRSLLAWLEQQQVQSVTLIPCGPLAALPLTTIPLTEHNCFSNILPTSVVTCAHAIHLTNTFLSSPPVRAGVYALGDPRPTHQDLPWGEAEAQMLWHLARAHSMLAKRSVQFNATRRWLVETALKQGLVVSLSCHGQFVRENFLRSALLLAQGERIQLVELFNGTVQLRGLRLLILSACQTQVFNLSGAYNEVRSLASGALQAGARAVLGSLWPVNDRATFLLMTCFALEWFPAMETTTPAEALAHAQYWLRNVTYRALAAWSQHIMHIHQFNTQSVLATTLLEIQHQALLQAQVAPDTCPYASPYYWAGFQITGW